MEPIAKTVISHDWIILLYTGMLLAITLTKVLDTQRLNDFLKLLFNNKYVLLYGKEEHLINPFNTVFLSIHLIAVATFLWLLIDYNDITHIYQIEASFINLLLLVILFSSCTIALQKIVANIFNIDAAVDQYLFKKISYGNWSGLLLACVNLFIIYSFPLTKSFLFLIIIITIIIHAIGWFSIFKMHQNILSPYLFYFILYLCALEIAPYLLAFKLIAGGIH